MGCLAPLDKIGWAVDFSVAVAAPVGSLQRCPVANWGAAARLFPLIVSLVGGERDEAGHWKLLAEEVEQDMGGGLGGGRWEECIQQSLILFDSLYLCLIKENTSR